MEASARQRFRPGPPALLVLAFLVVAGLAGVGWIRRPAPSPVARGRQLAASLGCFACHGPGGMEGIPNPGSATDVPAWGGGTAMMYFHSPEDIREYILFGRRRSDPDTPAGLIRMPAFRTRLSPGQLRDLAAYVQAVAEYYPDMPPSARNGVEVAHKYGCFGCHGPSGRGGMPNAGAFKAVIPGWDGGDFADLSRDDAETRAWIQKGKLDRWEGNPLARFFLRRQVLSMPAYGAELQPGELDALLAYIHWLRTPGH